MVEQKLPKGARNQTQAIEIACSHIRRSAVKALGFLRFFGLFPAAHNAVRRPYATAQISKFNWVCATH
jgi:hypothetical protein